MSTNLLPAIVMAGPPHCGKSVLAYLLSKQLRQDRIAHIVLRAAPDGEGDFSQEVDPGLRVSLTNKGDYTDEHVRQMLHAIYHRHLPMIVDIGGLPRGDQFKWLEACTHSILLYRQDMPDKRTQWQSWLNRYHLLPIASLQSELHGEDIILHQDGELHAIIAGLSRGAQEAGPAFAALYDLVKGICDYPGEILKAEHLRQVPAGSVPIVLDELAEWLGLQPKQGGQVWWDPANLEPVLGLLPEPQPLAIYGRGPIWLFAAIAAHTTTSPIYVFDARHYGWTRVPAVSKSCPHDNDGFDMRIYPDTGFIWLQLRKRREVLKVQPLCLPRLPNKHGIVLDGTMPNWLWAAVVVGLRSEAAWIAMYEPRASEAIVVWGVKGKRVGERFAVQRPQW